MPQSVWYAGLVIFLLAADCAYLRATRLLAAAASASSSDFHPKSAKEELKEELDDLERR